MKLAKKVLENDKVQVALWVGGSYLITLFFSALLEVPELASYYGIINIVLYTLKNFRK